MLEVKAQDLVDDPVKFKCLNDDVKVRLKKLFEFDEPDEGDIVIPAAKLKKILSDLELLQACKTRGISISFHPKAGLLNDEPVTIAVMYGSLSFTRV